MDRARLKDNDLIEGLAQNDLTLLESEGLFLIPPDTRSNTQRIFLPRQAVAELDIVAVIKTGARRGAADAVQESLFTESRLMTPVQSPHEAWRTRPCSGSTRHGDQELEITGVEGIEKAGPGQLTFVANPKYTPFGARHQGRGGPRDGGI